MLRAYLMLLRLYPAGYRLEFSSEMSAVFGQSLQERRSRGWAAVVAFVISEWFGVLREATALRLGRESARSIDLTRMRPPELSRDAYTGAVDEVLEAQRLVAFSLRRMQEAIAMQAFAEARSYSDQERRARERLRVVREKYGILE